MVAWFKKKKRKKDEADTHDDFYLPGLQARAKRRRRRWLFIILLAFSAALLVLLLRLVIWTPFLHAETVQVAGLEQLSREEAIDFLGGRVLAGSFWRRFLGSDNMLAWPTSFSPEDLAILPTLKSVQVRKNWRDKRLEIIVEERMPTGVWCLRREEPPVCYWFDIEGMVLYRAPLVEGNLIPVAMDYARSELGAGEKILPPGQVENFFSVLRVLRAVGISAREIHYEDAELAELKVLTAAGPSAQAGLRIYFSLRFPANNAYSVLVELQKRLSDYNKLEYVDFRTENRAYYK